MDYGFNGYEVPRAARSPRSAFKKKSENNQISSFDLLAAVAGKLLLEGGGNSSSSSNNASETKIDYRSETNHKKPMFGGMNSEGKLSRSVVSKDEHHVGSGLFHP
ncbi:hypothetical protein AALP_AAs45943U000100 [Arabis alpina]|uniref:Uncharacterized protein n=1 Tax=Arabis alpina TaxID=50452 RepID=A0A087G0G1_ARAAL|nr:hypothetical protein AALP_AAs45943U000100 [Arabis alpina]